MTFDEINQQKGSLGEAIIFDTIKEKFSHCEKMHEKSLFDFFCVDKSGTQFFAEAKTRCISPSAYGEHVNFAIAAASINRYKTQAEARSYPAIIYVLNVADNTIYGGNLNSLLRKKVIGDITFPITKYVEAFGGDTMLFSPSQFQTKIPVDSSDSRMIELRQLFHLNDTTSIAAASPDTNSTSLTTNEKPVSDIKEKIKNIETIESFTVMPSIQTPNGRIKCIKVASGDIFLKSADLGHSLGYVTMHINTNELSRQVVNAGGAITTKKNQGITPYYFRLDILCNIAFPAVLESNYERIKKLNRPHFPIVYECLKNYLKRRLALDTANTNLTVAQSSADTIQPELPLGDEQKANVIIKPDNGTITYTDEDDIRFHCYAIADYLGEDRKQFLDEMTRRYLVKINPRATAWLNLYIDKNAQSE